MAHNVLELANNHGSLPFVRRDACNTKKACADACLYVNLFVGRCLSLVFHFMRLSKKGQICPVHGFCESNAMKNVKIFLTFCHALTSLIHSTHLLYHFLYLTGNNKKRQLKFRIFSSIIKIIHTLIFKEIREMVKQRQVSMKGGWAFCLYTRTWLLTTTRKRLKSP